MLSDLVNGFIDHEGTAPLAIRRASLSNVSHAPSAAVIHTAQEVIAIQPSPPGLSDVKRNTEDV